MTSPTRIYPMTGYLLVRHSSVEGYLGVERKPLVLLYPEPIQPIPGNLPLDPIWNLYSTEWERNAYKLLEENFIDDPEQTLELIESIDVARAIKNIIEPHLGFFEILHCKVWDFGNTSINKTNTDENFLGYDIAYSGGDYFSAIRSGLFTIDDAFTQKYKPHLNENGLFNDVSKIDEYILDYLDYREVVPSEATSEFVLFELQSVPS